MPVRLLTASPTEAELYNSSDVVQRQVDNVVDTIQSVTEPNTTQTDIILVLNDTYNETEYELCFSGTPLSLAFYPDRIDVLDFNDGDEEVLESFNFDNVKAATLWLINKSREL